MVIDELCHRATECVCYLHKRVHCRYCFPFEVSAYRCFSNSDTSSQFRIGHVAFEKLLIQHSPELILQNIFFEILVVLVGREDVIRVRLVVVQQPSPVVQLDEDPPIHTRVPFVDFLEQSGIRVAESGPYGIEAKTMPLRMVFRSHANHESLLRTDEFRNIAFENISEFVDAIHIRSTTLIQILRDR